MRRFMTRYLILVLGLAVAACSNNPPPTDKFPPVSFRDQKPFVLDIAKVEIVNKYQSSSVAPHIEFDMPVSPENAMKRWIEDRIQPRGTAGTMRVVINDASATETPLPKNPDESELFTKRQISRIDMSIDVSLQMLDERQFVKAEVTGKASRSRTLPEGLKLNERDQILYDMVVDLIKGAGSQIDPQIANTFGTWMVMQ
jgi:hypothetical protein